MWRLFCHYLFLISPSFGASGGLCFIIVAFPGCPHMFEQNVRINRLTLTFTVHLRINLFTPNKRDITNSVDPDQTPQIAASDQGLICLDLRH